MAISLDQKCPQTWPMRNLSDLTCIFPVIMCNHSLFLKQYCPIQPRKNQMRALTIAFFANKLSGDRHFIRYADAFRETFLDMKLGRVLKDSC